MRLRHYLRQIEEKIEELALEYRDTQGLILTEDDLKWHIVRKLYDIDGLPTKYQTIDQNIFGSSIHTEISWYDQNGELKIKPDITILEPQFLSILHNLEDRKRIPNKQCHFAGHSIIFELKFIRNKSGITKRTINSIQEDIDQVKGVIENLEAPYRDDIYGYIVVFNKTRKKCAEFDRLLADHNRPENKYKILYFSGEVLFERRKVRTPATEEVGRIEVQNNI